MHPTKGTTFILGADMAGLGGTVKYVRSTVNASP